MKRREFLKAAGTGVVVGAMIPLVAGDPVAEKVFGRADGLAPNAFPNGWKEFGRYQHVDWELGHDDHRDKLEGACKAMYENCYRALREQATRGYGSDPKTLQFKAKELGSYGMIDPVQQRATLGWKVMIAPMPIEDAFASVEPTMREFKRQVAVVIAVNV